MRVALGIVVSLLLPSWAAAAEVSYSAADATVKVAAATGEANALTVGLSGRTVTVHDDGAPLTAGGGCTGSGDVTCAVPACALGGSDGCPTLEIDTGDGDDRVTLSARGAVAADTHLGAGNDTFTLDGGAHATVFGEAGDDVLALRTDAGDGSSPSSARATTGSTRPAAARSTASATAGTTCCSEATATTSSPVAPAPTTSTAAAARTSRSTTRARPPASASRSTG